MGVAAPGGAPYRARPVGSGPPQDSRTGRGLRTLMNLPSPVHGAADGRPPAPAPDRAAQSNRDDQDHERLIRLINERERETGAEMAADSSFLLVDNGKIHGNCRQCCRHDHIPQDCDDLPSAKDFREQVGTRAAWTLEGWCSEFSVEGSHGDYLWDVASSATRIGHVHYP